MNNFNHFATAVIALWFGRLEELSTLNTLDLTSNRIASCEGLSTLSSLEELWMGYNLIDNFEVGIPGFESIAIHCRFFLSALPIICAPLQTVAAINAETVPLKTVYLEHNPIAKEFTYRKRLKTIHPGLTQIDSTYVR